MWANMQAVLRAYAPQHPETNVLILHPSHEELDA